MGSPMQPQAPPAPTSPPSLQPGAPPRRIAWLAFLIAALSPPAASAQVTPDPDPGTGTSPTGLTKGDFEIRLLEKDGDEYKYFNDTVYETFFNRARCLCDAPVRVQVNLTTAALSKVRTGTRAEFRMRAGDQTCVCTGANCANLNCKDLGVARDLATLVKGPLTFDTTVRTLFEAGRPSGASGNICDRDEMQNLWLWMDSDDAGADTELTDVSFPIRLDGVPPGTPTGLRVSPGNEALEVSWDALSYLDDLQGYIIFCSRGGDLPVFKAGTFSPEYTTPAGLCPGDAVQSALSDSSQDDSPSEGTRGPAPAGIAALDPAFVCSDILTSGGPRRIYQLQNGIPYAVGISSVDKRGNASAISEVVLQEPIPTRDFYKSYKEAGGSAEGGFCTVGGDLHGGGRRSPALALAVLGPLFLLALRRSRRRR
jgi:hypothetical protein